MCLTILVLSSPEWTRRLQVGRSQEPRLILQLVCPDSQLAREALNSRNHPRPYRSHEPAVTLSSYRYIWRCVCILHTAIAECRLCTATRTAFTLKAV